MVIRDPKPNVQYDPMKSVSGPVRTSVNEASAEIVYCWQSAQVGQIRTREDYYYEELRGSSLRVLL